MKVKKRQHKCCALNDFAIAQSKMVELNEYMNLKSEQWLPKLSLCNLTHLVLNFLSVVLEL